MSHIPNRLKEARKAIGYSLARVAIKSGIPHSDIRSFENGYTEPKFSELSRLAELYKVSIEFLMGDKPMEKLNFVS